MTVSAVRAGTIEPASAGSAFADRRHRYHATYGGSRVTNLLKSQLLLAPIQLGELGPAFVVLI